MSGSNRTLRLLAVVAHPHDLTHMCGTLAHHIDDGDSVTAVSMTGGTKAHMERLLDEFRKAPEERDFSFSKWSEDEYDSRKSRGLFKVCAMLGITDARILPFEDKSLRGFPAEAAETLAHALYEVRPHIILTHDTDGESRHGRVQLAVTEHIGTGLVLQQALMITAGGDQRREFPPYRPVSIYFTGISVAPWEADMLVDITDQAENRLKAEVLFSGKTEASDFDRKRLEIGPGHAGWHAQTGYAESWIRQTPLLSRRLIVTEEETARAEMSQVDTLARLSTLVSARNP